MAKMSAMCIYGIYGKNSLKLPQNQWAVFNETWYEASEVKPIIFYSMMALGWPWHILLKGQIW